MQPSSTAWINVNENIILAYFVNFKDKNVWAGVISRFYDAANAFKDLVDPLFKEEGTGEFDLLIYSKLS